MFICTEKHFFYLRRYTIHIISYYTLVLVQQFSRYNKVNKYVGIGLYKIDTKDAKSNATE